MQISYLPTWTTVMPLRAPRETVTNACVPQFLQTASLRHDCGPLLTFGGACLTIPAYGLFIQHHGSSPHVTYFHLAYGHAFQGLPKSCDRDAKPCSWYASLRDIPGNDRWPFLHRKDDAKTR